MQKRTFGFLSHTPPVPSLHCDSPLSLPLSSLGDQTTTKEANGKGNGLQRAMTSGKRPTNATMNRTSIGAPLHQQEVPPLPPRLSTSSCDRHPDLPVTGFCASCLRERLQVLDPNQQQPPTAPNASSSALRRCKSFSFARERPTYSASSSHEPHRRSCDARSRGNGTIPSLFHIHPEAAHAPHPPPEITPEPDTRPMKEHIDLDGQSRRPGSFWVAASVFSKKLQSWRKKHKDKKKNKDQHPHHHHNQQSSSNPRPPRSLYEWRSEDARRSCDTDPRFSFDGGRLSLDCSSFDLPRASWDGNLLLGRPSASAVNSAFPPRLDGGLIPVEEDPGGTTQTREYYADTSQRRRRSLDRSASVRRTPPAADPDEPRTNSSNARVSNYECYFWDSLDCRECPSKKEKPSGRWSRARSLWGLLPKRAKSEKNGVERSMSVVDGRQLNRGSTNAAPSFGGGGAAAAAAPPPPAAVIGGRHSFSGIGGSVRRGGGLGGEWNGQVRKRRDELPTMERNRSARYSPGRLDNGMLRFYLTPMRGSTSRRRTGRFNGSNSITRSVLRLY